MDYDSTEITAKYNVGRALTQEAVLQWRSFLESHIDRKQVSVVVDLGCGTGRFSELLAAHFDARIIAIEPSQKMLDEARRKPPSGAVLLQRASAEALPLADGSADLIFMSMVYHHLTDPLAVAEECGRVLRHGGHVCIRNGTRESDFPHRHFFPAIGSLIESHLPTRSEIRERFALAGLVPVVHEIVTQTTAPDWQSFVDKSATRADSFLARITDAEFERGIAALNAHRAVVDPTKPVTEEIDWFLFSKQVC
jgi:ubiquinone/menaquinone biosynthesis C-methylase UbiE